jgi:hypothetical protein
MDQTRRRRLNHFGVRRATIQANLLDSTSMERAWLVVNAIERIARVIFLMTLLLMLYFDFLITRKRNKKGSFSSSMESARTRQIEITRLK